MKKIYCYGVDFHTYIKTLLTNPPKGYEFIINKDEGKASVIGNLRKNKMLVFFYKNIFKKIFNVFKILDKVYYQSSPKEADLIFSHGQLIRENKPWIVEILDSPSTFAGNDARLFKKNVHEIEKILESPYCKRIIVHFKEMKEEFNANFSKKVLNKIEILPPAIPPNSFKKIRRNNKINFLFMGSINNPNDFYVKGGYYALEAFSQLSRKFPNIHLNMRSKVPEELKKRYNQKNISFLENNLSPDEIKQLYSDTDILLATGYFYFLMLSLEALSYGLPIIALDTYGVSNFFRNNKNAFLIKPSEKINYPEKINPYLDARSPKFIDSLKISDERVVNDLCEKASLLIESKNLRKKFGRESLRIFNNIFSLEKRNQKLKKIFDEALS